MKSYVFNNKFLSLTSKQRTPLFRMKNRRGSEKEGFQNFWGEENPRKSLKFLGPNKQGPPPSPRSFMLIYPSFPAACSSPAPGQALGCSPGPRAAPGVKQPRAEGHGVWKMLCSPDGQEPSLSIPTRGLWQCCSAVPAEMGALAWINWSFWLPALFTHQKIQPLHRKVVLTPTVSFLTGNRTNYFPLIRLKHHD